MKRTLKSLAVMFICTTIILTFGKVTLLAEEVGGISAEAGSVDASIVGGPTVESDTVSEQSGISDEQKTEENNIGEEEIEVPNDSVTDEMQIDDDGQNNISEDTSETSDVVESSVNTIISQPEDQTVIAGTKFTFEVTAEGDSLTYLWQYSKDGGNVWIDTTRTRYNYSSTATESLNGRKYRCIITDKSGNKVITDAATLTVTASIEILSQTSDQTVNEGSKFSFKVEASGVSGSKLSYLWQYCKDKKNWKDTTRTVNNYGTTAACSMDGMYFRCKITDAQGITVYSEPAMLQVLSEITITEQPEDQSVHVNEKYTFRVTATGSTLTYLWQYSKDGGKNWVNTSRKRNNYGTTAQDFMNGRMFRCIITDSSGNTVTSDTAQLTVVASSDVLSVAGYTYKLGNLIGTMGTPDETLNSTYGFTWYVYGTGSYTDFVAAGVDSTGTIVSLLSAGPGFEYQGMKCGSQKESYTSDGSCRISIATDSNDNNIVHAVCISLSGYSYPSSFTDEKLAGESKINFHLTNAFRVYHGMSPCQWDDQLAEVARLHSVDMAENNYFSHSSQDGTTSSQRITNAGISWWSCGENITTGTDWYYGSGYQAYNGWVNSSGHRSNMLTSTWTQLGVGGGDKNGNSYFTQDYIRRQ